jgi:hypothetical protein
MPEPSKRDQFVEATKELLVMPDVVIALEYLAPATVPAARPKTPWPDLVLFGHCVA